MLPLANTLASTTAATGLLPTFLAFLFPCLPPSTVWLADWRLPPQAPCVCEGMVVNDLLPQQQLLPPRGICPSTGPLASHAGVDEIGMHSLPAVNFSPKKNSNSPKPMT